MRTVAACVSLRTSFLWPRREHNQHHAALLPQQAQVQSPSSIMHYNSSKQPMVAGDATGRDRRTGHRGTAESWCLESASYQANLHRRHVRRAATCDCRSDTEQKIGLHSPFQAQWGFRQSEPTKSWLVSHLTARSPGQPVLETAGWHSMILGYPNPSPPTRQSRTCCLRPLLRTYLSQSGLAGTTTTTQQMMLKPGACVLEGYIGASCGEAGEEKAPYCQGLAWPPPRHSTETEARTIGTGGLTPPAAPQRGDCDKERARQLGGRLGTAVC